MMVAVSHGHLADSRTFFVCPQEAEIADKAAAVLRAQQLASELQNKLKAAEQQLSVTAAQAEVIKARAAALESEVCRSRTDPSPLFLLKLRCQVSAAEMFAKCLLPSQVSILPEQLLSATSELVKVRGSATTLAREKNELEAAFSLAKVGLIAFDLLQKLVVPSGCAACRDGAHAVMSTLCEPYPFLPTTSHTHRAGNGRHGHQGARRG